MRLVSSSAFPAVRPGQLWFAVLSSSEHNPAPLVYRAVTTVNVIIYDRVLAPTVARLLPLGGYAEPAAALPAVTRLQSVASAFYKTAGVLPGSFTPPGTGAGKFGVSLPQR